jgi:hypothetical protein
MHELPQAKRGLEALHSTGAGPWRNIGGMTAGYTARECDIRTRTFSLWSVPDNASVQANAFDLTDCIKEKMS